MATLRLFLPVLFPIFPRFPFSLSYTSPPCRIRPRNRPGHDQQRAGLCAAGRGPAARSRCCRSRSWSPPARSSRGRMLPSFLYLAAAHEAGGGRSICRGPTGRDFAVGELARRQAAEVPDRTVGGGQVVAVPQPRRPPPADPAVERPGGGAQGLAGRRPSQRYLEHLVGGVGGGLSRRPDRRAARSCSPCRPRSTPAPAS